MKPKYEALLRKKNSARDIILEKGLTEAQAKKIVNAFPVSQNQKVLYRIDNESIKPTKEELKKLKEGLKKPVTKGLTTLCAKTVGASGRRKKDGTVKKGYVAKKGGKVVAVKKKAAVKKK